MLRDRRAETEDWLEHLSPLHACMHAVLHESCLTPCNPMDCSTSVCGILQARILEWGAPPSSRGPSQPRDRTHDSYISCIGRWVLYH